MNPALCFADFHNVSADLSLPSSGRSLSDLGQKVTQLNNEIINPKKKYTSYQIDIYVTNIYHIANTSYKRIQWHNPVSYTHLDVYKRQL